MQDIIKQKYYKILKSLGRITYLYTFYIHMNPVFINFRDDNTSKYFKHVYDYETSDLKSCKDLVLSLKSQELPIIVTDRVYDCVYGVMSLQEKYSDMILLFISSDSCLSSRSDSDSSALARLRKTTDNIKLNDQNIIILGVDDSDEEKKEGLCESDIFRINKRKMMDIGWETIDIITKKIMDKKVALVVNGSIEINQSILNTIVACVKDQIVSVGFCNNTSENDRIKAVTGDICRQILGQIVNIKERSLNIYDEKSKFLIYRPSEQLTEEDYGWFIIRGCSIVMKNELLSEIGNDSIIEIDNYLITSTTINEQNQICYYTCNCITDTALYPEEKQCMMFELLS